MGSRKDRWEGGSSVLNRMLTEKKKKEWDEQERPPLHACKTAMEVRKWIPSIRREINKIIGHYTGGNATQWTATKIREFEEQLEELRREYKRWVRRVSELDPDTIDVPGERKAYISKRERRRLVAEKRAREKRPPPPPEDPSLTAFRAHAAARGARDGDGDGASSSSAAAEHAPVVAEQGALPLLAPRPHKKRRRKQGHPKHESGDAGGSGSEGSGSSSEGSSDSEGRDSEISPRPAVPAPSPAPAPAAAENDAPLVFQRMTPSLQPARPPSFSEMQAGTWHAATTSTTATITTTTASSSDSDEDDGALALIAGY